MTKRTVKNVYQNMFRRLDQQITDRARERGEAVPAPTTEAATLDAWVRNIRRQQNLFNTAQRNVDWDHNHVREAPIPQEDLRGVAVPQEAFNSVRWWEVESSDDYVIYSYEGTKHHLTKSQYDDVVQFANDVGIDLCDVTDEDIKLLFGEEEEEKEPEIDLVDLILEGKE